MPKPADATGARSAGTASLPSTPMSRPPRRRRRSAPISGGFAFLRSRWDVLTAIAAGGALGSLGRWGVSQLVVPEAGAFPWSTFVENVSGGLALGCLMVLVLDVWPSQRLVRPFLGVGPLGGYTTFSTYMLDTRTLLADGHAVTAMTYLCASLSTGIVTIWRAIALTRLVIDFSQRRHAHHRARDTQHTPNPNTDRRNTR